MTDYLAESYDKALAEIERLRNLDADRCRVANSYIIDNARLADKLAAAQTEIDTLRDELDEIKEVEFPRRVEKVAEGWRGKCERLQAELDALRLEDEECPVCGEVGSLTSCGAEYCGLVSGAPKPPSVPDGWQLVPVEPTDKMILWIEEQWMCGSQIDMAYREYKAALAAAPKPGDGND